MTVSPGTYAGVSISADQAAIANTIANVGYSMGATQRDVTVAYMAAMAESSMRNLTNAVDHDSLGVFQQRPSQGWGSPAQVTDPAYASRKFFEALFAVPARDSLSLQLEAQRVQRSAFSDGSNYGKWAALAQALVGQNPSAPGGAPASGSDSGALGGISGALGGIADAMSGFGKIAVWLAVPTHWTRIFAGGFGIVFIVFGLRTIAKEVHN